MKISKSIYLPLPLPANFPLPLPLPDFGISFLCGSLPSSLMISSTFCRALDLVFLLDAFPDVFVSLRNSSSPGSEYGSSSRSEGIRCSSIWTLPSAFLPFFELLLFLPVFLALVLLSNSSSVSFSVPFRFRFGFAECGRFEGWRFCRGIYFSRRLGLYETGSNALHKEQEHQTLHVV